MKNKNSNQSGRKERLECSEDTKLFFDDVYKLGTRGKKQQVDVLQHGRSMIEMLGVLAIVGVLSVGGIAGYSKAMEKFKINKTIDQVSTIVANIRTLYAQQSSYGEFWDYDINKMGVVPDDLPFETAYFRNELNAIIHIISGKNVINEDQYFLVSLGGLSKSACISLAAYDWGDLNSTGLAGIAIGSQTYDLTYSSHVREQCYMGRCSGNGRIPLVQIQEYCSMYADSEYGAYINFMYK